MHGLRLRKASPATISDSVLGFHGEEEARGEVVDVGGARDEVLILISVKVPVEVKNEVPNDREAQPTDEESGGKDDHDPAPAKPQDCDEQVSP